jgi:flavin reductase (DIM6/NTAB) family NADH-FMN oxidoreductase RutF
MTERTLSPESPIDIGSALGVIASGVTLVTIADGRDDIGVTVSAFVPLSLEPPLIGVSLIASSYPAELLGRTERFAVTVLSAGQRVLAGRGFSPPRFAAAGRPGARLLLHDVPHHRGDFSGALIADEGLAALECEVSSRVPVGDHLLVIAHVRAVPSVADRGGPLIRFRGRYPALARG